MLLVKEKPLGSQRVKEHKISCNYQAKGSGDEQLLLLSFFFQDIVGDLFGTIKKTVYSKQVFTRGSVFATSVYSIKPSVVLEPVLLRSFCSFKKSLGHVNFNVKLVCIFIVN